MSAGGQSSLVLFFFMKEAHMEWKWKGFRSIKEAIDFNTKGKADEILSPGSSFPVIQNADICAMWLIYYAVNDVPITIVGDYDCDGICASASLYLALRAAGAKYVYVRLPKRMSEGYGMSPKIIGEIPYGVVVTVDNGIAAHEAVRQAKEKGLIVIITDHHLPVVKDGEIVLPEADLIVDPHVESSLIAKGPIYRNTFNDYCGAGLVYRIAGAMLRDRKVLRQISAFAAIATVADVMPLLSDNRKIFAEGVQSIQDATITTGLKALVDSLRSGGIVTESDIGFKIAPMLNAPGRLIDDGASLGLGLLLENSAENAQHILDEVNELNENRKQIKAAALKRAASYIAETNQEHTNPVIINDPETPEGVIGLVAGTVCEDFGETAIVFTEADGILKGSGRACEEDNLKDALDTFNAKFPGVLLGYGGHKGAAGLSIRKGCLEVFKKGMSDILSDPKPKTDVLAYDLKIDAETIVDTAACLMDYSPFGEGNPPLVFRIDNFRAKQFGKSYFTEIGNGSSIRMSGDGADIIGFGLAKQFHECGDPSCMDMIGKISYHYFNGRKSVQVEMLDLKPCVR